MTFEVASTSVMIERTRQRFGLAPSRLDRNAACGAGLVIGWLRARGTLPPRVRPWPVLDGERQKAKGLFGRSSLAFDPARNACVCPAGHDLVTSKHVAAGGLRQYRAHPTACGPCALNPRCTTGLARMVTRQSSTRTSASTSAARRHVGTPARRHVGTSALKDAGRASGAGSVRGGGGFSGGG